MQKVTVTIKVGPTIEDETLCQGQEGECSTYRKPIQRVYIKCFKSK